MHMAFQRGRTDRPASPIKLGNSIRAPNIWRPNMRRFGQVPGRILAIRYSLVTIVVTCTYPLVDLGHRTLDRVYKSFENSTSNILQTGADQTREMLAWNSSRIDTKTHANKLVICICMLRQKFLHHIE